VARPVHEYKKERSSDVAAAKVILAIQLEQDSRYMKLLLIATTYREPEAARLWPSIRFTENHAQLLIIFRMLVLSYSCTPTEPATALAYTDSALIQMQDVIIVQLR